MTAPTSETDRGISKAAAALLNRAAGMAQVGISSFPTLTRATQETPSTRPQARLGRDSVVFRKAEIYRIAAKICAVVVSLVEGRNAWRPDELVKLEDKTAKNRATRGDRVATRIRCDFQIVR